MSRDVSQRTFTGLGLPIAVEVWEQQSTYTEDTTSSRAGVPVPDDGEGASKLALSARGAQAAGGGIQIRSQRGGFATQEAQLSGATLLDTGASFVWRAATLSAGVTTTGAWRGWEPPINTTRYQSLIVADGSTTTVRYVRHPHVITLQNGTALCCAQVHDTSQPLPYQIVIWQRSGVSDAWARVTSMYGSATAPTVDYYPTMCQLPSGRIVLFYQLYDSMLPTYPISGWYSDDNGAADSWNFIGDGLTNASMGTASVHLRCAQKDGQVLLLSNLTGSNDVMQFGSSDSGNTFNLVETWATTVSNLDIAVVSTGFLVALQFTAPSTSVRILGDAYSPLSAATSVTIDNAKGNGDFAICADETGVVYAYLRPSATTAGHVDPYLSFDGGLTWTEPASVLSAVFLATGTYPSGYSVCAIRGQVLLLGNHVSSVSSYDPSLSCWTLGGFSTVTLPRYLRHFGQAAMSQFDLNYCPIELPTSVGWTTTSTGGSTESIATGGLVVTSSGGTQYYTVEPAADPTRGIVARFVLSVGVGAALGQELCSEIIVESGGGGAATDTGVRIEYTTSTWRLWDLNAGAAIGATQTYTAGTLEVLVAIAGRAVSTWWRRVDTTAESGVREWTAGPTSTTLGTGALHTADRIRWGHVLAGTRTSTWLEVAYGYTLVPALNLASGQTSPDDLFARLYSNTGVYAGKNVTIAARGGPTWIGESWTIQARNDKGLERAITLPSPRMGWTSTSATQTIALTWDDGVALATEGVAGLGLIALYLGDCNVETVQIKRRVVSGGTWSSVGTVKRWLDGGDASSMLAFDALNNTVRPGARDGGFFCRTNEFKGGWFIDENGAHVEILDHSDGRWNSAAPHRPVFRMASNDLVQGTGNNEGKILPKDSVLLFDLSGYDTPAIQILLTNTATTVKAGVIRVFRVLGLGHRPDWSRTVDTDLSGVEIAEARDGTIRARSAAPPRRTASIAWMETAIDQTAVDTWGDPDFIHGSSDAAMAIGGDQSTAYAVEGATRQVEGATDCVLYLPSVAVGSGIRVLNRRHQFLYGRIVSDTISSETVLGEEGETELVRLTSCDIREEL